ncbi:Mov34/MPN/PAD-1 family protein [uncultured Brevundimonas sp.]|uniref:Mov34/MPN/PAD-1 family protein n=1 Tax=uncultured Brevundimonas sp. TaxID=213418 RepID=UPI003455C357
MTGTFAFDESDATQGNLVGEIHSHPGGNTVPSVADWARVDAWSGWTGRNFRSYVIARDTSDPNSDFAIRVYDTTSDRDIDANGPEVNPEAAPCSS